MSTPEGIATSTVVTETIVIDPSTGKHATPAKDENGPDEIKMPKSAFNARLDQARTALLKELGIDNLDAGKAAIASAKAADEAKKSDAERAATSKTALEKAQADLAEATSTMSEVAKATLEGLTEEQKATVLELAGDDPARQIKTVNTLKKSWASSPPQTAPALAAVPNTAPTQPAPKDNGNTGSAPDPQAIFVELMKTNPFAGTRYGEANGLFKRA